MGAVNFNPQINSNDPRLMKLGGLTITQPRVAPVSTGNEFGISIPQNHSYTRDENGNQISLGQDGVGLAHKNPKEFGFMAIA